MKKQARFILEQAAMMDRTAIVIFTLTRRVVSLMLAVSLIMLAAVPFSPQPYITEQAAESLVHASFRVVAMGAVTGFIADIALRKKGKQ